VLVPLLLVTHALATWYTEESGPTALWRAWGDDVQGHPIDGGHFFPEEAHERTAHTLSRFFGASEANGS
jgi:haloacetate dehalogenase